MTDLQTWMEKNGWDDVRLAKHLGLDRSQISRIRRRVSGTSKAIALKLERLTGTPWHAFIGGEERGRKGRAA